MFRYLPSIVAFIALSVAPLVQASYSIDHIDLMTTLEQDNLIKANLFRVDAKIKTPYQNQSAVRPITGASLLAKLNTPVKGLSFMTQLYQPYANSIVYTQYPWQEASMRSIALSLTGAYRIPDTGFSFSGSVDWVKVRQVSLSLGSGNGHLGIGDSPLARLTSEGSSPMSNSYHVAAGYQYDPLALKLLLSYHAKAGYQHHLTQNFFVSGKHPSEITFDAQMGISPTTLLTTGVMYNQYKGSNVYLNGPSPHTPFQLTHFGNSAAYKVGVGHKLSQTLSMGLGLQYSPGSSKTGDDFLSPTNGSTAIQLGLNYKLASATVSTSYSSVYFGDKIVGPSSPEIAYLSSILYNSFNSGVQPFNPTLAFKNSRANIPSVTVSYRY